MKRILKDPAVVLTSTGGVREEWVCVQAVCEKAQGNRFEQAAAHVASARHKGGLKKDGVATRASKHSQKLAAFKEPNTMTARCFDHRAINFVATRWILADPTFSLHLLLPPSHSQAMEGQQTDEDMPQAGSDEPLLPPKATEPRSGLDFLRGSAAPVTPDPPRSTVDDSAVKDTPTATPEESPREAAFTIPPAVASCSKDPQPTAPSPTPSTVRVSVGPPSATSTPKRARSGKWAQHTLLVGGRRLSDSNTPDDPPPAASAPPEEDVFPIRADTGSPALTKAQLREQMFVEASIIVCMAYGKENTRYARQGDDGGRDMQTQAFRAHEHTDVHKVAVDRQLKIARGIREGLQVISNFINSDVKGRRAIRLLRSVVFLCKCDAPISMYPRLMRHLAEQDTPDIPRQYGFQQMVHCLSTYLTNAQMHHINSSPFPGLQCDESTDRTRGKHMIVYLTFIMDRRVVTKFFTLLTVEKCDAASLFEVLMNHLRSAGVDVSKLVRISKDGASVMTGKDNGLVARIREHASHLFSCHCIAHR
ncbi:unnamed protein product [Closterium sp. NIES-54]